jgi:enamine deaminase RidA (YjgF/YER057c/UK114 family)
MAQKLEYLSESASQTAGPYVHIGLTPNFCDITGVIPEDPGKTMVMEGARGERIIVQNRVHFHRLATTLNYLDIRTVVVSCGTCLDQLEKYEFDQIFPGSRLLDIHEYLLEKGVKLAGEASLTGVRYMYHDPCHSPIKGHDPLKVVNTLMNDQLNGKIEKNDRCCGESQRDQRQPVERRAHAPMRGRCLRISMRAGVTQSRK